MLMTKKLMLIYKLDIKSMWFFLTITSLLTIKTLNINS